MWHIKFRNQARSKLDSQYSKVQPEMDFTKRSSNIPLLRVNNGEVLSANPLSTIVVSSIRSNWHSLVVEEHRIPNRELDDVMYIQHIVAVNVGRPVTFEHTKNGRGGRVWQTGTVSLFPSHHAFFSRRKKDETESAHVILVALDPVFVSQTSAALEVYSDSVELVEKRGRNDPTLQHIVMALHAGLHAGHTGDPMYGEAFSTALAVHLLRVYGGIPVGLQHAHGGLSRDKLIRAVEYIHDQLETGLTVSGIAQTVHMSPYHFTRLFKQSTGQSPYRYVIQARVKKARELLTSGKFSIIEIAHRLGFSDQSHLTRHLKHAFGLTPKMLQERPDPEQDSSKDPQEYPRERVA